MQLYPPDRPVLSIEEYYVIINKVLNLQMGNEEKRCFVKDLNSMLHHTSGRFYCLLIVGLPSAGKTWFSTIVGKLMLKTEFIGNSNRYSQFPFQDCPRRNFLIFETS